MSENKPQGHRRELRFVVLEDDWQQAESIKEWLESEFSDAKVSVIDTAKKFQRMLPDFKKTPPDVFILDMMVRYTDPDDEELRTDNDQDDFLTAGARCHEELRRLGLEGRSLIYSVTDKDDLAMAKLEYLADIHIQKGGDKATLLDAIRKLTRYQSA